MPLESGSRTGGDSRAENVFELIGQQETLRVQLLCCIILLCDLKDTDQWQREEDVDYSIGSCRIPKTSALQKLWHVQKPKEELKLQGDIVCVPIQILVCRTCEERYSDRQTIHFLEEVEQKLREGKANLQEVGRVLIYG